MHYHLTQVERNRLEEEILNRGEGACVFGAYCETDLPLYYANDAMAAMLDYDSVEQMAADIGGKLINTVADDDVPRVLHDVGDNIYEGKPFKSNYHIKRRNGSFFWVACQGKVIRAHDGRFAIVCLCTDVSEIIWQRDWEANQKAISDMLIRNIPGGYHRCSLGEGYPFLYISDRFLEFLGWTEEEIHTRFGNRLLALVHPEDVALVHGFARRILNSPADQKFHEQIYRMLGKNGYRWISDAGMQVEIAGEKILQGSIADITTFVESMAARDRRIAELQQQQVQLLEHQLDEERRYLDVLAQSYLVVYHVDLIKDTSMLIKVASVMTGDHKTAISLRQLHSYSVRLDMYAEKFVSASYRADFRQAMSAEALQRELKKSPRFTFRYRCMDNDGALRFYDVEALRVLDDMSDGNVLIAFRDVDALVAAENRRQVELEEKLEQERIQNETLQALDSIHDATFRINLLTDSYTQISCNEQIQYYYNGDSSAQRMLQAVCDNIVSHKHQRRMREFFNLHTLPQRLAENDTVEAECVTRKGTWHRARFIVRRRDGRGHATHVLYLTQIINDEKHYEQFLIERAEDADYANRAKTNFVSQVAHDIRTPMNSIFGFLEIAQANLDDMEKVRYSLEKIRTSGEFLKSLVDDVLDVSRMEQGKMTLQPEKRDIRKVLEEFAASITNARFGKKQDIVIDLRPMRHPYLLVDDMRLRQIYSNLLTNAIKYTPDGGKITFTVCQEEAQEAGKVCLVAHISDNGVGMSEAFMKRMFTKFERGTDTRINKVSGYGLGLSIVKQIVEMMGGTVSAESKLGRGTTFHVRLDLPYVEQIRQEPETSPDYGAICAGMRLLVAEDNVLNREVITELLQMHRIDCLCAEDGVACLEAFRQAPQGTFDAVLMDMQMPNMDGLECSRQLRALELPDAKTVPIIAMTANALKEDVQKCLDAGMNVHLSKPVDIRALLKTLAQCKRVDA